METVDCIFCPKNRSDDPDPVVIRDNGWEGRQCRQCRLIYISPRPSRDEIANAYAHDSAKGSGAAVLSANEPFGRMCARHSLRLLSKYTHGRDLLEIGRGAGFFLDEARHVGFRPYGIELNLKLAERISNLGIACHSSLLSLAFPGRQFDIIYHCDVTSHFFDPIAEFRTMAERLRPGGILMFETGNLGDVHPHWYSSVPSFQYPDHLFFLSAANVPTLLERSGFSLLRLHRYCRIFEFMMLKLKPSRKDQPAATTTSSQSRPGSTIHRTKAALRYFSTYYLGAIFPPSSVPQTLIVIARKQ